jgi:(p)ppGpp synthase/HD superfamily hydrolase
MNEAERTAFHPDFERAFRFAAELHAGQTRKGSNIPYIAHLIAVAGLVLDDGGGRNEAIAALLHDSIEDQGVSYPGGVAALRETIAADFGARVLAIVEGCTDADTVPKPPWIERKKQYVMHLRNASDDVRLVSCADKLHNARSIVADLRRVGVAVFERFTGGKEETLWYYKALAAEFSHVGPQDLAAELSRTVAAMDSPAAC